MFMEQGPVNPEVRTTVGVEPVVPKMASAWLSQRDCITMINYKQMHFKRADIKLHQSQKPTCILHLFIFHSVKPRLPSYFSVIISGLALLNSLPY